VSRSREAPPERIIVSAIAPKNGTAGSSIRGETTSKIGPAKIPANTSQITSGMPVREKTNSPNAPINSRPATITSNWATGFTARFSEAGSYVLRIRWLPQRSGLSQDRSSTLLFLALNGQVTAGLHERFYRFVYTRAVLIVLERNIDAALIASNRNHLQVAFFPVPSRKYFASSWFVICVKSRCFTTLTASA
jgi:hypothetical protein